MRLDTDQRRKMIVTAAVRIAREQNLAAVNHGNVAKRCPVATNDRIVRHYFTRRELWEVVVAEHPDEFAEQAKDMGL